MLLLSDAIQRLTVHENAARTIPDALVDALLDVLDVMMQLSYLHNAKNSLRNDFSVFKRFVLAGNTAMRFRSARFDCCGACKPNRSNVYDV